MAFLYLSPSTQEYNPYVNGGNEEYYMNLLADWSPISMPAASPSPATPQA